MLLYFGSRRMMHQGNTCLCDVHHRRPNLWDLPEPTFASSRGLTAVTGYGSGMVKQRLDTLLTERGLFPSRTRAAASVMAGEVSFGEGGPVAVKPGEMVPVDAKLSVRARAPYVSRGGVKLANALDAFELACAGRLGLDVGASTGGFTDCLLSRGVREVVAVDVGYGDFDYGLRTDPRVTLLERTNARTLEPAMLPYAPDLVAIDVSFISLGKVLPAVLACVADRYDLLALVKPQFEVGRERVGKGGVVRSAEDRRSALIDVGMAARKLGAGVLGYASSGLPGPKGNLETFVWLAEHERPGQAESGEELEKMAREVEP